MKSRVQRVLMTADAVGGVFTYAVELIRALAWQKVNVTLATMGGPLRQSQRETIAALANCELVESNYRLEWMPDPWDDVTAAGEWLLGLEHTVRPDLIHLNGFVHAALPWRAPTLVVAHSCVLSWWRAVRREPAPADWDRYRAKTGAGIRAAHLLVAPTQAMLTALLFEHGPHPRTRTVPNGRHLDIWRAGGKAEFIFSAGRLWDEAKNINALQQVAPRLPWPVLVAGETTSPDGGPAMPLSRQVHALGQLDTREMNRLFSRAAIYALPARYEPFGLTALEAALHGCALVLGDIPSQREIWGDAAQYVAPDDTAALEATLCTVIEQPLTRAMFGERARCRARELTPARMAAGYMAAYDELGEQREAQCAS